MAFNSFDSFFNLFDRQSLSYPIEDLLRAAFDPEPDHFAAASFHFGQHLIVEVVHPTVAGPDEFVFSLSEPSAKLDDPFSIGRERAVIDIDLS